ncbi:hypothetical protein Tco_1200394 [Tanacetum coccineum]
MGFCLCSQSIGPIQNDQEDDDAHDDDKKAEDDDDEELTESDNDGDDFVHPKLTTHDDEIIHEKDTDEDDSSISSSDEDDSDNDDEGANVAGAKSDKDATDEQDPRESFDELTDSTFDFSAFVLNRLNVQTLTPELLAVVIQRRVEDLQLGVESYQKKLNLTKPDTYRSNLRRQDAYTPYSDPRGFIYENKDKKNRLMRIDELHKFSDGTLDDVRTALNDRLKGIRMEYLPQTFWSQRDKANARAMIQAIDKRLKTRRIMRSLERFVGGRPYGGDLRLLQRTI